MLKIGTGELLVILMVALLIFGPSKLPALGKMAGKAIGTLRHYADSDNWDELMEAEEDEDEQPKSAKKRQAKETDQPEADDGQSEESQEAVEEQCQDQAS